MGQDAVLGRSVGLRVQGFPKAEQALVVAQLAAARKSGCDFSPRDLSGLAVELGLPEQSKSSNAVASLERRDWVRRGVTRGNWRLTPLGRARASELLSEMDYATLAAEAVADHGSLLGKAVHSVIPPTLAPPTLLPKLQRFLAEHPFETNVFAMSRFPVAGVLDDPIAGAVIQAREICHEHGLELHLASDRAIDDDLWTNVAGHMWACRYGLAIFENRVGKGVNYNLTIEVGSMLMTGRRCALLKDSTVERLPTDLVGRIYKEVDLDRLDSVSAAVKDWICMDLGISPSR